MSELLLIAKGSFAGSWLAEWFQKYFLAMVALPMAIAPVTVIFTGNIPADSDAAWYGLLPAFLLGIMIFALALPDNLPKHRKGKDQSTKVYYLLPVQALITIVSISLW